MSKIKEWFTDHSEDLLVVLFGVLVVGGLLIIVLFGIVPFGEQVYKNQQNNPEYNGNKKQSCSIFVNQCIVDEWEPACLLTKCIIDGRAKNE